MRLTPEAGSVLMRGEAHWRRCSFGKPADEASTVLMDGVVALAPLPEAASPALGDTPFGGGFAGLAFDSNCRLFHIDEKSQLEYLIWGKQSDLQVVADTPHPYELAVGEPGDFTASLPKQPVALACDKTGYLCLADPGTPAAWLVDIWQHEVARQIPLAAIPKDVAFAGDSFYLLLADQGATPGGSLRFSICGEPQNLPWPAGLKEADRLDLALNENQPLRAFVIVCAGTQQARLVCLEEPSLDLAVPFCTDFLIGSKDSNFGWLFVFALRPGEAFLQYRLQNRQFMAMEKLSAPNYNGLGIAFAPDGRVAYLTARGLRHAAPARTRHLAQGFLVGYALDSGLNMNEWGRIIVEACIPEGTSLNIRCHTRDDLDYNDALPRTLPANWPEEEKNSFHIELPEATPLPSHSLWDVENTRHLFRDDSEPLLAPSPAGRYAFYDAPVMAGPGRYLWLTFEFSGGGTKTPKLRSVRVEYPQHGLLRQLPKTLWREPFAKAFLGRYLMPLAALLAEWDDISANRHRLLDGRVAPSEALAWLGSLMGLSMDNCWPEQARRQMILEGADLFRRRGTLGGLKRMIAILTGLDDTQVIIIEKFKLRSGGVVGNAQAIASTSMIGVGFRVGGSIGRAEASALDGPAGQGFDDFAHRFTVMIATSLSDEQRHCLLRLVEVHKPAHTQFDLCSVDAGMRVSVGLHVGLSSMVGKSAGFDTLVLNAGGLGKGALLGCAPLQKTASGQAGDCGCHQP